MYVVHTDEAGPADWVSSCTAIQVDRTRQEMDVRAKHGITEKVWSVCRGCSTSGASAEIKCKG